MRPTLDETDILDSPSPASPGDESHESSRRERSPLLAWLGRLFIPVPRLRPHRQACGVAGAQRFEAPLDMLAREHLHIYLLAMGGMV